MTEVARADGGADMLRPGMPHPDEYEDPLPFAGLEKSSVVQETKVFGAPNVTPEKAVPVLLKLLYVLYTRDITPREADDVFFNVTKLFQHEHQNLRRLVYIVVKELASSASSAFVIANTLMKDMNSDNPVYRANATRCVRRISDATMLLASERYLKQVLVDQDDAVASAALATGIHISSVVPEMVRRWYSEVRDAVNQRPYMAFGLLCKIRRMDYNQLQRLNSVDAMKRWVMPMCLLVRVLGQIVQQEGCSGDALEQSQCFKQLAQMLTGHMPSVIIEAARVLLALPDLPEKYVQKVMQAIRLQIGRADSIMTFAALRTAAKYPAAAEPILPDLLRLFQSPNKQLASLAVSITLQLPQRQDMEQTMKSVGSFISGVPNEYKVQAMNAVRQLARSPNIRHGPLLSFLADAARDDVSFEYKRAVVEALIDLVTHVPGAQQEGLLQLCELIEDCEYNPLLQRVIHFIGDVAHDAPKPHVYIRYLYNRAMLEYPSVRASAVLALSKIAARCPPLRASILVLLNRSLADLDDEVRDRAALAVKVLSVEPTKLEKREGDDEEGPSEEASAIAQALIIQPSVAARKDIQRMASRAAEGGKSSGAAMGGLAGPTPMVGSGLPTPDGSPARATAVAVCGEVPFVSSQPALVTDAEGEYVIHVVKHAVKSGIIVELKVQNATEEFAFHSFRADVDASGLEGAEVREVQQIEQLPPGETGSVFVILDMEPNTFVTGAISANVNLTLKEVDSATGEVDEADEGVEATYPIEEIAVDFCDYVAPAPSAKSKIDFVGADSEVSRDEYALSVLTSLQEAVNTLVDFLRFAPLDGCETVPPNSAQHNITMAGTVFTQPDPTPLWVDARVFTARGCVSIDWQLSGGDQALRDHIANEVFA